MTYNEFKNKYNEKYIDHDGAYGNQCWDLVQKYFIEVLGLPESVLSGCGLVSNMLKEPKRSLLNKYFDEVKTTEMYQGDVCIWEYGHIAIFDNWDGKKNNYFSQNPNPCRVISINRSGLHAFRLKSKEEIKPKEPVQPSTPTSKFKIGQKVIITGNLYTNSNATNPAGYVSNKTTTITKYAPNTKHPYNTTGNLGWMDESSITNIESSQTDILTLVKKTIRGDFGVGQARKNALGSNFDEVQRQVELNKQHGTTRWDNIKLY